MKLLFISIFLSLFTYANAAVVGTIEKLNGNVKVKKEGSIKKSKVKQGFSVEEGDLLSTSKKATAIIKLSDGSTLVLDASSSVHFKSVVDAEQKSGKVYYKVTSRSAKNSLKVRTPFAIIGIKGTTFVVDAAKNGSVSLKEGLIGVASIKEEFNLYRKKLEEEFNKFKSDQMAEFEKFKSAQTGYLPPVKTKQFDLQAGNRITFGDNRVNEDQWNKKDDEEFSHFEKLLSGDFSATEDTQADDAEEVDESEESSTDSEAMNSDDAQVSEETPVVDDTQEEKSAPVKKSSDMWDDDDDAEFGEMESAIEKHIKSRK